MDLSTFNIGPITGISAVLLIAVIAVVVILLIAVAIINSVKVRKEAKDDRDDIAEREFFAEYGVTPEEVRLNQRIVAYRGIKDKNMIDYKGDDLGVDKPIEVPQNTFMVEDESQPVEDPAIEDFGDTINIDDIAPAPEELINDSLNIEPEVDEIAPAPIEEPVVEPAVEEVKVEEPVVEPAIEEPVIEAPTFEPILEEPAAPAPVSEPVPVIDQPKEEEPVEEEKKGVDKPETKKVVKKKPDDWSKYDGEYEGYYYDPEDACYYEGKPSAALAKKLEAKKAEIEAQNLKSGKKVVIKKVAPPFATLKTPKHERKDPAPYAGFDESKIYGKYVIEHTGDEYYYSLYSADGTRLYESGNYSTLDFCKKAIDRFKSHALIGTYTIEADGDKFCAVIKRKTYVHKGDGRSSFAEAENHMNQIKDFAQTDIIREQ